MTLQRMKLPRASLPIALASVASLAAQVLFSLLMLRLFAPQAVGEFSVISQIAFVWMTLALAQSPLKLLADAHQPARPALRTALLASLLRMGWLAPLVGVGVLLSGLAQIVQVLAWASALALLQLAWYLAQPLTLRIASPRSSALVRALWLLPALANVASTRPATVSPVVPLQADGRSAALRLAHTTADALTGVALLLVWQRSHGAAEAGYLALLLRVLGFVPALIHAAWAQVLLAQGANRHSSPLWVGLGGALVTALFGLACLAAVQWQWLAPSWAGLLPYLWPLVLWQAGACLLAACSHLPFQQGRASLFSYAAIAFDVLQLTLLGAPLLLGYSVPAATHVWWLGTVSAIALLAFSVWLASPEPANG